MMKCILALVLMGIVPLSMSGQQAAAQTKDTAGYWHGHPGELYTAAFSEKGSTCYPPSMLCPAPLEVQFQGGIDWTASSITTTPDFAVKSTKTSPHILGSAWLPVKSFKIDKAALVVVTGNGETLRLHDFDIHFFGKFDRVTNKPVNSLPRSGTKLRPVNKQS
jgi:hypothetical protein